MALVVSEIWNVTTQHCLPCKPFQTEPTKSSPGTRSNCFANFWKQETNTKNNTLLAYLRRSRWAGHLFTKHTQVNVWVKKCAWCRKRTSNARALSFEISQREAVLRPRTGVARDRGAWTFPHRPGDFPRKTFQRFQFHSPEEARSFPPNRLKRSKEAQCRKIGEWTEIDKRE